MTAAHRLSYTYDDYLAFEASSNVKHEYLDGQIYAMAGGTPEHAALSAAVIGLLFGALRGGSCRVYDADLRVHVPATGLSTYPDVTVVCGPKKVDGKDKLSVVNPTVLVEVLSRSTEEYDRGEKFEHYRTLPSLKEYVLVWSLERKVEVRSLGDDGGWTARVLGVDDTVDLASLGARFSVRELYEAAAEPTG
ncbi:MAG: Uma2 family endonuclease [Byssovorax sp.]